MRIYRGKNKAEAKQISFRDLLIEKIKEAGIDMENGGFWDENHSWVGIVQDDFKENKKDPKQLVINFGFNHDEDEITSIHVYASPIVTIVDDENMKKLI